MTIPSFSQLTSVTACLCLPWLVQAQKTYTVADLGSLGGDFVSAFAVNEHGQIAGRASTPSSPTHAFLFSAGILADLGSLPGWTGTVAKRRWEDGIPPGNIPRASFRTKSEEFIEE